MWSRVSKLKRRRGPRFARAALALVLLCALSVQAPAARLSAETLALYALPELRKGNVATVTDGATLVLDDGTGVRLSGIEPILETPGGNSRWEDAARMLLESLVVGHGISLRGPATPPDRYGRITAQLIRDDGLWIEGALLAAGAVRVEPPTNGLARFMLRHESLARRRHIGLWQSPLYEVENPAGLDRDSGRFILVEADVRSVEERSGVIWLDLGNNAAARLDRPARRFFMAAGLDPSSLTGRHLRLRGWVHWQGRPVLDLADPDSVEIVARPRSRRK
ncbi:MAG: thermonuclease family protein [Aliidongia sp.]